MKHVLIAIVLMMNISAMAQAKFTTTTDAENGSVVYNGLFDFNDLSNDKSFKWYNTGVENYKPNAEAIAYLKANLPAYKIVTLMGTWCEDSQNLVPKLYKVLQESAYPAANHTMYGVDRTKKLPGNEHVTYNLVSVPTIIVYKGEVEVGRIVEVTKKSIEDDLVAILKK